MTGNVGARLGGGCGSRDDFSHSSLGEPRDHTLFCFFSFERTQRREEKRKEKKRKEKKRKEEKRKEKKLFLCSKTFTFLVWSVSVMIWGKEKTSNV